MFLIRNFQYPQQNQTEGLIRSTISALFCPFNPILLLQTLNQKILPELLFIPSFFLLFLLFLMFFLHNPDNSAQRCFQIHIGNRF